jgi:hypothetical protein
MSVVDAVADKAEAASERLAGSNGLKARLAHELAQDATFLRKLKPRLMAMRARGEAPTNEKPGEPRQAPSGPQLGPRRNRAGAGPNPLVVIGAAFAAGVLLAKWIDWRGYAHPRW